MKLSVTKQKEQCYPRLSACWPGDLGQPIGYLPIFHQLSVWSQNIDPRAQR